LSSIVKQLINIVWFKRDLRFTDHAPLYNAQLQNLPTLLMYCFEPSTMQHDDSDVRHWRFVYESLQDMQAKLNAFNAQIYILHNEVMPVLTSIAAHYNINAIYSHQEVGNQHTYTRDSMVSNYCLANKIVWHEYQLHGVVRKLSTRKGWDKHWFETMCAKPFIVDDTKLNILALNTNVYNSCKGAALDTAITTRNKNFQHGGEYWAWRYMDSFVKERHVNYSKHISKPELSRTGCSRLSPYITYGNISMRMVYQYTKQKANEPNANKRAISNFQSRLHWHCHFMQKFEEECSMEFNNVNSAYNTLIKPRNHNYITAWQQGLTGIPIIDACIRCLIATGYINFRMRAMIVSFFVFNLWQDWRDLHFLARMFLDYEPGIHYPQLQMQSGVTGINTIRIYNPLKNSYDHDADGIFIKKWLPQLANVPPAQIHEPWLLSPNEQQMYSCMIGTHYPAPIVDVELTRKYASDIVWNFKNKDDVKTEGKRILQKHVSNSNAHNLKPKKNKGVKAATTIISQNTHQQTTLNL
jgi:deoxyribodipyrimidine photo-lyase